MRYQVESAEDDLSRQMWEEEASRTPMPWPYILLRKLRKWGSPIAMPHGGGYMDQPYLLMKMLEACMKAENEFNGEIEARKSQSSQAGQPT